MISFFYVHFEWTDNFLIVNVSKTEHCRMKRTTSSFWDIYKIYVVNIIYYLMAATFLKFAYKQGLMVKT